MTFQNPNQGDIAAVLTQTKTIAVVGLSDHPARPSFGVAEALQGFGYCVVPINPTLGSWQGIACFPTLTAAVQAGVPIDIVDVFRQPQHIDAIVDECLRLKLNALWLQSGVVNESAALRAQAAGMWVVMDKCIKVERMRMM